MKTQANSRTAPYPVRDPMISVVAPKICAGYRPLPFAYRYSTGCSDADPVLSRTEYARQVV